MAESFTDQPILTERFERGLRFALDHHRRQLRKGTDVPYFAHLMAVASLVLEMGAGEDEAVAALLHDVVEDGGGPPALERIRTEFGEDVARIVAANSDSDSDVKPPWRERKEAYVTSIAHKRPDELRVSLADKLHNARSILTDHRQLGDALWARFKAGEGESVRWYYRSLAQAFRARADDLGPGAAGALAELELIIAELDRRENEGTVPGFS